MGFDFGSLDNIDLGLSMNTAPKKSSESKKSESKNGTRTININSNKKQKEEKTEVKVKSDNNLINKLSEKDINTRICNTIINLNIIKDELNAKFIERENEIEMLLLALISSSNAFLHGPAGTGKSLLTEELSNRIINSNYFRILMSKTTEPAEVFGSVSINAMKDDKYKVNTKGKLPTAHIAFTDECFKANSAVLNSLLTIMNEKLFFNDTVEEVPLISLIGASNEFPEESILDALYDRFLLRLTVYYIQDHNNSMNLFANFLESRKRKSKLTNNEVAATSASTVIELEDLLLVNEKCKEVDIPMKVLGAYNMLFIKLEKAGIIISDRRKNEALKVIQASAILNNRTVATAEDLEPLKYVLWNDPKDLQTIIEEVNAIANPNLIKYEGFIKTFNTFKQELQEIEDNKDSSDYEYDKSCKITEINKQLNYVVSEIDKVLSHMDKSSKDFNKFNSLRNDISKYLQNLLKDLF